MAEHRDAVTNRLAYVILTIQLGERTGTLTIERDADMGLEEGYIVFTNGQVAWAKADRRDNEAAFNWLKTWTICRFAFIASAPPILTLPRASTPSRTAQLGEGLLLIRRLGLSQSHRQVFLLIDRYRTMSELARLTGRRPDELEMVLSDLEKVGVIHR